MFARSHMHDADGVAIVGLAGRFPGASDVATFWANLCAGVESIERFRPDEIEDAFDATVRGGEDYVAARSVLADADQFDAGFFGMHAREAELTDPQHRVLLECAWTALEDAGCNPEAHRGAIGVVAGCSIGTYFLRHVMRDRPSIETFTSDYQVASFPELLGSGHDFLATRIAYKLNLRGPALTVQSACSTSLLAVAQAVGQLTLGHADVMLAGAASITFPQKRGYRHQAGGMVSADGHCRSFDARANGTVFGSGAGMIVLKRLADARADGDRIYAVIRGVGVTNDGSRKVGYTAPSVDGQASAIAAAHAMANFEAGSIQYVEAHGTATPLGDPIEIAALHKAFAGAREPSSCALGSVKTNIGHLDVAAGMSGIIKTALAIHHGTIPPTLHFEQPNPHIDFGAGPFFVNTAQTPWRDERRRAGVSAFGLGGTNVHVVLDAPPPSDIAASEPQPQPQLLVLAAATETALAAARLELAQHLDGADEAILERAAFTLQTGRRAFAHRFAVAASGVADAVTALRDDRRGSLGKARSGEPQVAFLFPGQGSQYVGMGRDLYARIPVYRAAFDRCSRLLRSTTGLDLTNVINRDGADAQRMLQDTACAQPAIFAVEYSLAQVWMSWGVVPSAMIGHSVGEFVAACIAGVLSLDDALAFVAERGRLMQQSAGGAMLAVRLPAAELQPLIGPSAGIAAINSPSLCVAAGPFETIDSLETLLTERGVPHRRLATSHAFHSPMMDAVIDPLVQRASTMRFSPPAIPYVSSVTGTWVEAADATSPAYWGRHCREPVRFSDGIATLVASDDVTTMIEVGPGTALCTFAAASSRGHEVAIAASLREGATRADVALLDTVGQLWTKGAVRPDWRALHGPATPQRTSLPTYPFERTRYWIDAPSAPSMEPTTMTPAAPDLPRVQRELADLLEELSGESIAEPEYAQTFLELGFDSLFLGRFAQQVQNRFRVPISFRELLTDRPSIAALANYLVAVAPPAPPVVPAAAVASAPAPGASTTVDALMREQMQAMQQLFREQLAALRGDVAIPVATAPAAQTRETATAEPSRFDVYRAKAHAPTTITPAQANYIERLIARTIARTSGSKALTARYRPVLADPRSAAGFRAEWKEMVYPITAVRAHGSRVWDVDGNEYIDIVNGFGQTFFGHAPAFVVDAVSSKLAEGFAIGPQTELAGEVAALFCELTGNERVTFCNTGSEAVMAAMRVARTVTGRDRVVVFNGAYHGQFDEVLVISSRDGRRSIPAAPGIPSASVSNMTVLRYGNDEDLAWIREHADEIAAVIVEPVQSRHPALQPAAFLRELRAITAASGTALVFDEVVTGFRMDPGGMQHVFGIRADLATYGKVAGGGLPVGILAGAARFMDALDGGMWEYGDDSFPGVAPTFFAGTFVRHPLVLAAVRAVLLHVKAHGAELQKTVTERTTRLVQRLNDDLGARGIATRIEQCGSLFAVNFASEEPLASLLYFELRARGIYALEGFPFFLTTEHGEVELDQIATAFSESLTALQAVGCFGSERTASSAAPVGVPLTEEQTEIWLAAQLGDDASRAFNESVTLQLAGPLDEAAFAAAWNALYARHDALRATFAPTGEVMRVSAEGSFPLKRVDLAEQSPEERGRELAAAIDRAARVPFDLVAGPLVRGELLRRAPDDHAFVLAAHHIVCDGWSINVLLDEFATVYAALARGDSATLPASTSFAAYACGRAEREPQETAHVESFWREQFAQPVMPLALPTDHPRPLQRTFAGATSHASISLDAYEAVKRAGARSGCTLFTTLLAGFAALLGRLADQRDVVVAVPAAGQSALGEESVLVGHCVHLLPLRLVWNDGDRVADLLGSTKRLVMDAYDHQETTLGTLVRQLPDVRSAGRLPLTDVQFNLERLSEGLGLPGLTAQVAPNAKAYVNFDLFLNVIESRDGLRIDCDYNTDLFDEATIARWLKAYETILGSMVADAMTPVERLAYLPRDERRDVFIEASAAAVAYPAETRVEDLFEAQAGPRAGAVAVICGDDSLTYGELAERVNRFAAYLCARTSPGDVIGIALERSTDLLVALLGTLKAGCAYVPLDRRHPAVRLRAMLVEAGVRAVVVDDAHTASAIVPEGVIQIDLHADAAAILASPALPPAMALSSDDLAYVIFTSGSTGAPKGVEIAHRSVVNLLRSMAAEPGLGADDVLLAVTTVAFDIAALELFLPLTVGGTVAIATNEEVVDGALLLDRIERTQASAMQATPSTWQLLLEAGFNPPAGFKMWCGGEALTRHLANRLLAGAGELWNMYGPTETTIWSSCARIIPGDRPIDVGHPIANTQFYILDDHDQPVGVGQTGHLHIAGLGLARGYVQRDVLTAERFIANPFGSGRLYRTGDLARRTATGETQILGRNDQQVKLRGFRVELGEIEAVLAARANLAASAVALREDASGTPRLVAYVVERGQQSRTPAELMLLLADALPEYMIPTVWVRLDALPLTANGKIDRNALPAPETAPPADHPYVPPQTKLETALAEIWCNVLKRERIGTTDDLLALGADSINLFAIVSRANREGIPLLAKQLLAKRTIRAVAELIESTP